MPYDLDVFLLSKDKYYKVKATGCNKTQPLGNRLDPRGEIGHKGVNEVFTCETLEIKEINPNKEIINENAVKLFGLTSDCFKAGFILEDGSMLNFGSGMYRMDHSEITPALTDELRTSGKNQVDVFEDTGNAIRVFLHKTKSGRNDLVFELSTNQNPTQAQKDTLKKCCEMKPNTSIAFDLYNKKQNLIDSEYVEKANCNEIDKFFNLQQKMKKERK